MFKRSYSKQFNKEYCKICKLNPQKANGIDELVGAVLKEPRSGVGRPERLKHKAKEVWSRHIDRKNRLVYSILDGNTIRFESCEGHYNDH
jgi:toxin YoeB